MAPSKNNKPIPPKTPPHKAKPSLKLSPVNKTKYHARELTGKPLVVNVQTSQAGINATIRGIHGKRWMLMTFRARNGKSPYIHPLVQFLEDPNNQRVRQSTRVSEIMKEVDPREPTTYLTDPPKKAGGYAPPYWTMLCHVPNVEKNTPQTREQCAKNIVNLNNSRIIQQSGYGNNPGSSNMSNHMHFVGDVTPDNSTNSAPWLSQFLTIGDVMTVIGELYQGPDGTRPSDHELSEDDAILEEYFHPDHRQLVKVLYGTNDGNNSEGGNSEASFKLQNVDLD